MLKSRKPKDISLYLTGATASGKSKLALELAALLNGEIITVDSMQVYRAMEALKSADGSRITWSIFSKFMRASTPGPLSNMPRRHGRIF
jgi:cytidylate kinase